MHRFLIPLFALAILLTACGGGGEVNCDEQYTDETLSACLPEGWITMDRETLTVRGVPEETVAAFRREESVSGQFPSVTVTRESLSRAMTAKDYSDASIRSVSVLPNYKLVESPPVKIDGEEISLHVFTAQPIEKEPARRFYQASTVFGSVGYTVTAAAPLFVEKSLEQEIKLIIENVSFVKEEEGE